MTDVGFPATDDDERWKQEADDLRHTGLKAIRESAGKWLESIAVILGVFSVVAFVKDRSRWPTSTTTSPTC